MSNECAHTHTHWPEKPPINPPADRSIIECKQDNYETNQQLQIFVTLSASCWRTVSLHVRGRMDWKRPWPASVRLTDLLFSARWDLPFCGVTSHPEVVCFNVVAVLLPSLWCCAHSSGMMGNWWMFIRSSVKHECVCACVYVCVCVKQRVHVCACVWQCQTVCACV